jgi:hypothetical protein
MAPEFKMAAKNCFWSGFQKYAFFTKRFFFLAFPQYYGVFMEKLFFLIKNGGLYRDGVFVILKSPYLQKILCKQ